jgi:hypothetical protein
MDHRETLWRASRFLKPRSVLAMAWEHADSNVPVQRNIGTPQITAKRNRRPTFGLPSGAAIR